MKNSCCEKCGTGDPIKRFSCDNPNCPCHQNSPQGATMLDVIAQRTENSPKEQLEAQIKKDFPKLGEKLGRMDLPKEQEGWEKEFDEMRHGRGQFIVSSEVVKSFIRQTREEAVKAERERIKEIIRGVQDSPFDSDEMQDGYMVCKGKILKLLEDNQ